VDTVQNMGGKYATWLAPSELHQTTSCIRRSTPTSTRTRMKRRSFSQPAHQMVSPSPIHLAKIYSKQFTYSMFSRSKTQAGWPQALSMIPMTWAWTTRTPLKHNKHLYGMYRKGIYGLNLKTASMQFSNLNLWDVLLSLT
jgi:hypothetical protein